MQVARYIREPTASLEERGSRGSLVASGLPQMETTCAGGSWNTNLPTADSSPPTAWLVAFHLPSCQGQVHRAFKHTFAPFLPIALSSLLFYCI